MRPDPDDWRARLARGLTGVTVGATMLGLAPIATLSPEIRTPMLLVASVVVVALGSTLFVEIPRTLRALVVIAAFFAMGTVGYVMLAFLAAPAVSYAICIATAGLLFGRRAMLLALLVITVSVVVIGASMVNGVIPAPPHDHIDPTLVRPWLRTGAVTLLFTSILGFVLTWVVEQIEGVVERARKESERRVVAEALAAEAQRRDLMGRVAGALAHDVNNNLTVVTMSMPTLLADPSTLGPSERAEAGRAIDAAVTRASALASQLLVLGRRAVQTPRTLSLAEFVEAQRTTLRRLLPSDVALVLDVDKERAPFAYVDEGQLHQVLLNLVLNARDAMPGGGTLTVRATVMETVEPRAAALGTLPAGRYAVLTVRDTGIGIDDETRARMFEPFFTTKEPGKGTGLGLATVSAIVEQNSAHVVVETSPGDGTTVSVWFEAATPAPLAFARPDPPARPTLSGVRVLFCEDSEAVLRIADRILTRAGATLTLARDGDEAMGFIASASSDAFDLLVTDVVMPGVPVRAVISAFEERFAGRPILLCSGYVQEELVHRGLEEGRYRLVSKPYGPEVLIDEVARVLATTETDDPETDDDAV